MRSLGLVIFCFFVMPIWQSNCYAQEPGTLDSSFGQNGIVQLQIAQNDRATGIALQPDGKMVLSCVASGTLAVARCNPDGSLDNSFGTNGADTFQLSILSRAKAIAVQADGKIAIGGENCLSNCDFVAARLNSDGSLDQSFSATGLVNTDINGGNDYCNAIAIQADSKIILAGQQNSGLALVRYNTDGSLDNSFNDSGKLAQTYSPATFYTEANAVLVQPDGLILAAGSADPPANTSYDFVLFRFKQNGRRDSSFGINGAAILDFAGDFDKCNEAVLLPDGKIILAGYTVSASTGNDLAMARFNADGTLDHSFGNNGKVIVDLGGDDGAYAIALQPDGRILVGGIANLQFIAARFNPEGTLDSSFGINGVTRTTLNGIVDAANSMAVQTDGKIIAVGFAQYPPTPNDLVSKIALVRYHGRWGSRIDELFNARNLVVYPNPASSVLQIQDNPGNQVDRVQLMSADGTIVQEISEPGIKAIDIADLPQGIYLLRLHSGKSIAIRSVAVIR